MSWVIRIATAVLAGGALAAATGCGVDLGACDPALLDGVEGSSPHTAQQLVHQTCAGGLCHSQDATAAGRNGAPAGLDFDLVPASASVEHTAKVLRSAAVVREWREEMWDQIDSGDMPPEGFGTLDSDDKETVRNWLACGAPVVAVSGTTGISPDWASLWPVLETRCLACHAAGRADVGEGFVLGSAGDACGALRNLVNMPATTDTCMGNGMLVVPGNPAASLLFDKVSNAVPRCGARMPYLMDPMPAEEIEALRRWIEMGAQPSPDCP